MKLYKTTLILLSIFSLNSKMSGQSYNVTIENKTFVSLDNAEEIDAYNSDEEWPVFQIPIGFEFPFFDITSNTIYSNANSFGGYTSLNDDEDNLYMLVHFLANFIERGDSQNEILSPLRYKTEGTMPNRVFSLEYKDMGFFFGLTDSSGIYLDYINIQVRLFEENGNIEFHIGPYVMNEDPDEVFDGFSGPFIGIMSMVQNNTGGNIGEVVSISGDINSPVISDNPFAFMEWPIPENTVFTFSNMSTSINATNESKNKSGLFPNPTNDKVTVIPDSNFDQIKLYNSFGQEVYSTRNNNFSISHLEKGVYYLKIISGSNEQTDKLIKL